jgi:hypothetical protein
MAILVGLRHVGTTVICQVSSCLEQSNEVGCLHVPDFDVSRQRMTVLFIGFSPHRYCSNNCQATVFDLTRSYAIEHISLLLLDISLNHITRIIPAPFTSYLKKSFLLSPHLTPS